MIWNAWRRFGAAMTVCSALAAGAASAQETVTLRFASWAGPTNFLNVGLFGPWFSRLEEQSGGKLKIEIIPGGSAAAPDKVFETVQAGLVEMGWSITAYNPGRFKAASVVELPLLAEGADQTAYAMTRLWEKGLIDGFAGVKVLAIASTDVARLHHSREVTGLADFRGAKVRAGGGVLSAMIGAIGATPVGMPGTAMAEALAKHVVDATTADWFAVEGFSLMDVTRTHFDVSFGATAMYLIMNQAVWDGLPPDIRKVFEDNPPAAFAEFWGVRLLEKNNASRALVAASPGHRIITPTEAELADWRKAADGVIADWVKATPNGEAVLAAYRAAIAESRAGH